MSILSELYPDGAPHPSGQVDLVVEPAVKDLGGFQVRRALPCARRRMVGPFIFLDQMGPAVLAPGKGLNVRPHPHIGLATLTYVLQGEIVHRDTLGSRQPILPGAVNWMTAGRGIAHSERSEYGTRDTERRMLAMQNWVALPLDREETDPAFIHHPADALPVVSDSGVEARVLVGAAYGARSPVQPLSETLYLDIRLDAGQSIPLPHETVERAVYLLDGRIGIAGDVFEPSRLLVFRPGDAITVRALTPSHLIVLGGEPMEGPRHIWWNFVSSRLDRIEAAKADWKAGRFGTVIGETEFIPLPEDR
ncbi:MAG TPA: pirin family protein [Rhodopila sp.]|jgi:redox-sensitive bicupin YhaK (pirin superfamily)|nr:pirin family protein [Rhodopila sp.]